MHYKSKSKKKDKNKTLNILLSLVLITVALFLVAVLLFFRFTIDKHELDEYGCPVSGPHSLTVILVDRSDSISDRQRVFISNRLEEIISNIPRYGKLRIYALGTEMEMLLTPVISVCNPGSRKVANPLIESPRQIDKSWNEVFRDPLDIALSDILSSSEASFSPIFESIQSINITSFQHHNIRNKDRHLIIISDLLQFTPHFNHYSGPGDFKKFKYTEYFRRVRTKLSGVHITLFYIPRETSKNIQGKEHQEFWKDYFLNQEAILAYPFLIHVEG